MQTDEDFGSEMSGSPNTRSRSSSSPIRLSSRPTTPNTKKISGSLSEPPSILAEMLEEQKQKFFLYISEKIKKDFDVEPTPDELDRAYNEFLLSKKNDFPPALSDQLISIDDYRQFSNIEHDNEDSEEDEHHFSKLNPSPLFKRNSSNASDEKTQSNETPQQSDDEDDDEIFTMDL